MVAAARIHRADHPSANLDEEVLDRIADLAFDADGILDLLEVEEVEPKLRAVEPDIRSIRHQVCGIMNLLAASLGKA